jgi:hypothetical protein
MDQTSIWSKFQLAHHVFKAHQISDVNGWFELEAGWSSGWIEVDKMRSAL